MDAEFPRIIFGSRHGFSQIVISQVSCSLNVAYSPDWQLDPTKGRTYLLERVPLLFDILRIANINRVSFSGVTTHVHLPSSEDDTTVIAHVCRKLLASQETNDVHDVEIKRTYVVDGKYFNNIVISNYRTWNIDSLSTGILSLSRDRASEKGIRIIGDFNDRYSFNETEGYNSRKSLIETIITQGFQSLQSVVESLEVNNE
jgi:hypothetical protein